MKYSRKQILYDDLKLSVYKNVYEPAEDTFLAADNLVVNENDRVLDVGTGCGILAILAAKKAEKVVATDINPHAVRCARRNAEVNTVADRLDVRRGNLFEPLNRSEKFSLIIFNAPYLPSTTTESRSWLGRAWAGGSTGRQVIDQFITGVPRYFAKKGRILLVQSSLANVDETLRKFQEKGFNALIIAEKKVSFETIVLIRASHLS